MDSKRIRSINWDGEEKQLFLTVLKEYAPVIENKSLDANTNNKKNKAWEEVHKKFNELNSRPRRLSQLKIQWKAMKINARKKYSTFKKEANKTGGGSKPTTPNNALLLKDLMNPEELLKNHDTYDSDGIDPKSMIDMVIDVDTRANDNAIIENVDVAISQDNSNLSTPLKTNMGPIPARNVFNQKVTDTGLKSKKDQYEYARNLISHSKMLKHKEHMRRMEMAEEEHAIKMAIYNEKFKNAILEREMLELKKKREESEY